MAVLFWSLWVNQISHSKSTTIWKKQKFWAFSIWLWIFCSYLVHPWWSKQNRQKLQKSAKIKKNQNWQLLVILFWLPWTKQMCYRMSITIYRNLRTSAFSRWLWIYCCLFGLPKVIKTKLPKITNFHFPKDTFFGRHPVIEAVVYPAIKLQSLHTTGVCTQNIKISGHDQKVRQSILQKQII